jgi:hypothetical protein
MATLLDWATTAKIAEDTGLSKRTITEMLNEGKIEFSKKSKAKTSSLLIRVSSFNAYWLGKREIIIKK